MVSEVEKEYHINAMIRAIINAIRNSAHKEFRQLYVKTDKKQIDRPGESCFDWQWKLLIYSRAPELVDDYLMITQYAFLKGIDLDNDPKWSPIWKQMMRLVLPKEFINTIRAETGQIPRLGVMDMTGLGVDKVPTQIVNKFADAKWVDD